MIAYVLPSARPIAPFELAPGRLPLLDRTLAEGRDAALAAAGARSIVALEPGAPVPGEGLAIDGSVYAAPRLLARFAAAARSRPGDSRLALRPCLFTAESAPLSRAEPVEEGGRPALAYPVAYVRGRREPAELDRAPPLALEIQEKPVALEALERWTGRPEATGLTIEGLVQVEHWAHLLDANRLAMTVHWFDLDWRKKLRYLGVVLRAHSWRKRVVAMHAWWAGRGCQIHPTAVLEGAVLGERVKVGPGARILGSFIGSGAEVQAGATVNFSVLGPRAIVSLHAAVVLSVLMEEAFVGSTALQYSVLGPRAALMTGSYLVDTRFSPGFRETVPVVHQGRVQPSGRRFLGCALGPGALVGTGLWVAAGRELPPGVLAVAPAGSLVERIQPDLPPGALVSPRAGRLETRPDLSPGPSGPV